MALLEGTPIRSLQQLDEQLARKPRIAQQTFGAEVARDGSGGWAERVHINPVFQGEGAPLYAEELLLVLARCYAFDLIAHADDQGLAVGAFRVTVTGRLDLRSMRSAQLAPAGFDPIDARLEVETDASQADLDRLLDAIVTTSTVGRSLRAVLCATTITPLNKLTA